MEKAIYVITGVMASGKSTIAEALAKSLDKCVHLRGDVFRKMIITGREECVSIQIKRLYINWI
ncbi:zeta toxin family protein [Alkaliphilus sp. B6464]|uniref:zeta toxin family protein n=1 Tax=Alkaliphilus sp. B6464 TaxID=2731219 RepID=UPI0020112C7A|nr:zeta toxin family protein [Alkaliphilus sp. B6464]